MSMDSFISKVKTQPVVKNQANVPQNKSETKTSEPDKKKSHAAEYMIGASAVGVVTVAGLAIAGRKGYGPFKKFLVKAEREATGRLGHEVKPEIKPEIKPPALKPEPKIYTDPKTGYTIEESIIMNSGHIHRFIKNKEGKVMEGHILHSDGKTISLKVEYGPNYINKKSTFFNKKGIRSLEFNYNEKGEQIEKILYKNDGITITNINKYNPVTRKRIQGTIFEEDGSFYTCKFNDDERMIHQTCFRKDKSIDCLIDIDPVTENPIKQIGFKADGKTKDHELSFVGTTGLKSKCVNFYPDGESPKVVIIYNNDGKTIKEIQTFDETGKQIQ